MTPETTMQTLKACPFCGRAVRLEESDKHFWIVCEQGSPCLGTGVGIGIKKSDRETAIAAWNRRPSPPPEASVPDFKKLAMEVLGKLQPGKPFANECILVEYFQSVASLSPPQAVPEELDAGEIVRIVMDCLSSDDIPRSMHLEQAVMAVKAYIELSASPSPPPGEKGVEAVVSVLREWLYASCEEDEDNLSPSDLATYEKCARAILSLPPGDAPPATGIGVEELEKLILAHVKPWELDGFPCITGVPEAARSILARIEGGVK